MSLFGRMFINNTVRCRYNTVQYNMIFLTVLPRPKHYLNHSLYLQKTTPNRPAMACLMRGFRRKYSRYNGTALYYQLQLHRIGGNVLEIDRLQILRNQHCFCWWVGIVWCLTFAGTAMTKFESCIRVYLALNSLVPGKFEWYFRYLIFQIISVIDDWGISCGLALRWMSLDLTVDKSALVQVMAWCRQATSHYLSQCWPWSLSPYGVTS